MSISSVPGGMGSCSTAARRDIDDLCYNIGRLCQVRVLHGEPPVPGSAGRRRHPEHGRQDPSGLRAARRFRLARGRNETDTQTDTPETETTKRAIRLTDCALGVAPPGIEPGLS